jgi:hypothetical protein
MLSIKILILIATLSCARARPADDGRITFRESENENFENRFTKSTILKSDNMTAAFMSLPEASKDFENGEYFQGDIALTAAQERFFFSDDTDDYEDGDGGDNEDRRVFTRTGIIDTKYRWPKNSTGFVNVPYVIDANAKYCEFYFKIN